MLCQYRERKHFVQKSCGLIIGGFYLRKQHTFSSNDTHEKKICTLTVQYSLYCWTLHCSCFIGYEDVVFFKRVLNIWRCFLYYFWSLWGKNIFWKACMLFKFFLIFVGGRMICQFSKRKEKIFIQLKYIWFYIVYILIVK